MIGMPLAFYRLKGNDGHPFIMETFSPEFSQYWVFGSNFDAAASSRPEDDLPSPTQQAALAALADRVSAARSVT